MRLDMYKVIIYDTLAGWVSVGGLVHHDTYDAAFQHLSKCKAQWPDDQFDISFAPSKRKAKKRRTIKRAVKGYERG